MILSVSPPFPLFLTSLCLSHKSLQVTFTLIWLVCLSLSIPFSSFFLPFPSVCSFSIGFLLLSYPSCLFVTLVFTFKRSCPYLYVPIPLQFCPSHLFIFPLLHSLSFFSHFLLANPPFVPISSFLNSYPFPF
jgi:hypothetical protein